MSSTSLWYATRATGIVALILLTATMVLGIATVLGSLLADVLYAVADPRVRYS